MKATSFRRMARSLYWSVERRRLARTIVSDEDTATVSSRRDQVLIRSKATPESSRTGLFLFGACDVPALLSLGPSLAKDEGGTTAIASAGHISISRADFLLQTLDDLPLDLCRETIDRLELKPDHFVPKLFEPTFSIPELDPAPFPKSVVVLSLGANIVRTLYRHNDTGLLIDPGGWWLGSGPTKVTDNETLGWFRANFTSIGRLTPETWQPMFRRVVHEIRTRTSAEVVVLNTLTIEPNTVIHNYGLRRAPEGVRRRQFHVALADIARELGVRVIDVDRILKRDGVKEQIDFAHFPVERFEAIAAEGHTVLRELATSRNVAH